jgi:hypothetical protein
VRPCPPLRIPRNRELIYSRALNAKTLLERRGSNDEGEEHPARQQRNRCRTPKQCTVPNAHHPTGKEFGRKNSKLIAALQAIFRLAAPGLPKGMTSCA